MKMISNLLVLTSTILTTFGMENDKNTHELSNPFTKPNTKKIKIRNEEEYRINVELPKDLTELFYNNQNFSSVLNDVIINKEKYREDISNMYFDDLSLKKVKYTIEFKLCRIFMGQSMNNIRLDIYDYLLERALFAAYLATPINMTLSLEIQNTLADYNNYVEALDVINAPTSEPKSLKMQSIMVIHKKVMPTVKTIEVLEKINHLGIDMFKAIISIRKYELLRNDFSFKPFNFN